MARYIYRRATSPSNLTTPTTPATPTTLTTLTTLAILTTLTTLTTLTSLTTLRPFCYCDYCTATKDCPSSALVICFRPSAEMCTTSWEGGTAVPADFSLGFRQRGYGSEQLSERGIRSSF